MPGLDPAGSTADTYRGFARIGVAGRSPAYEELALAVADDPLVLGFLAELPRPKRQPNLLFGAARLLLHDVPTAAQLHDLVADRGPELADVMLERRTQTNEPARCGTLLPALCMLPQPLALIEVGASAGLTLLPDLYSYDYDGHRVPGRDPAAPILACHVGGPVPLPRRGPDVVWRAGIDVAPLDVRSDEDMAWLSCLIWPGEDGRPERLEAAVAAARRHPPTIHRGDLVDDLPAVAAGAPADATLVVYHSAVLAYVPLERRLAFGRAVADLGAVWLSNEGTRVLPGVGPGREEGHFLLVRDGREVLAETDSHGTWLRWLAPSG
ncbi:MAG TPA: DUF2332 domain-containing protein [Acidimicrobiales bacterium]|nr:DUF2332 domain-containing protein [Acidimicrobiales bacterium]